jgi:hypothetical protein
MLSVVAGLDAVFHRLASVGGEVRVQLHHGACGRNRFGDVNLDLVVVLSGASQRDENQDREKNGPRTILEPSTIHLCWSRSWEPPALHDARREQSAASFGFSKQAGNPRGNSRV